MQLFRIHGAAYDAFDTMGTVLYSGRWHTRGTRLIYTAEHISLAALEVLIHAGGRRLPPRVLTRLHVPDTLSVEDAPARVSTLAASRLYGDHWSAEARTPLLRVPSVAVNGLEFNLLLNPVHPDFSRIRHDPPEPFAFDERLFLAR